MTYAKNRRYSTETSKLTGLQLKKSKLFIDMWQPEG